MKVHILIFEMWTKVVPRYYVLRLGRFFMEGAKMEERVLNDQQQARRDKITQLQQMGVPTAGDGNTFPDGFGPQPQGF